MACHWSSTSIARYVLGFILFVPIYASAASATAILPNGSIVFDPWNFGENTVKAIQTAQTATATVNTHLNTLRRYQEMIRQGVALSQGDIRALAALTGDRTIAEAINDSQTLLYAIKSTTTNLDNVQTRFNYTVNLARKWGLRVEEMANREATLRMESDASAQGRFDANTAALNRLNGAMSSYAAASKQAPETLQASLMSTNVILAQVGAQWASLERAYQVRWAQKDSLKQHQEAIRRGATQDAIEFQEQSDAARVASGERIRRTWQEHNRTARVP